MTGAEDAVLFEGLADSENPNVRVGYNMSATACAVAVVGALILGLIEVLTLNQTLYIIGAATTSAVFLPWYWRRMWRTVVRLRPDRLDLESANGRLSFLLTDIDSYDVAKDSPNALSARLSRRNPQYVRIRLRRRPRLSLIGFKDDADTTRVIGVPLASKTYSLYVADAQGLVDAIHARST